MQHFEKNQKVTQEELDNLYKDGYKKLDHIHDDNTPSLYKAFPTMEHLIYLIKTGNHYRVIATYEVPQGLSTHYNSIDEVFRK